MVVSHWIFLLNQHAARADLRDFHHLVDGLHRGSRHAGGLQRRQAGGAREQAGKLVVD
jgi:hypothetical protein